MGEYVRFRGRDTKIGTMEDMYYTSYQKFAKAMALKQLSNYMGQGVPMEYMNPKDGFRFRFPFPDEDKLRFGEIIEPYNRGIPIRLHPDLGNLIAGEFGSPDGGEIQIVQQKLIERAADNAPILALVIKNPATGNLYSIPDEQIIPRLLDEINRNHVANESDPVKKQFYEEVVKRIRSGYQPDTLQLKTKNREEVQKVKPQPKRGKGLR